MDAYADALGVADAPAQAPASSLPAPIRNNNPGALMPGGRLAVFNSPEEGLQALDQNLQKYGKSGVSTLRGVISKWAPPNENDTNSYIAHVSKVTGLNPDQKIDLSNPYTRLQLAAGIVQHENGAQASYRAGPSPAPAPVAATPAQPDPYADVLGIGKPPQPITAQATTQPPASPSFSDLAGTKQAVQGIRDSGQAIRGVVANQLTGLGASIVGGYRGLSTLITAPFGHKLEDAANEVTHYQQEHTYRGDTAPQQQAIESFSSPLNPVNIPNTVIDKASDYVADKAGPVAGTLTKTGLNAALLIAGTRGKPGSAPVDVGPSKPGVGVYRPLHLGDSPTATMLEQQYPNLRPPSGAQAEPAAASTAAPAGAPAAAPAQAAAPATAADQFRTVEPGQPVGDMKNPTPEMKRRASVLQSVGIEQPRVSSLTGDRIGGSTDVQISRVDSPAGRYMNDILQREKQSLADHATQLVEQTGGMLDKDQNTAYQRGETIVRPLDQLRNWYDSKAQSLYQAADERAQGKPVSLNTFKDTLADASEMTSPDRLTFRDAAQAFAKKNGMLQPDGSIAGTALQAETFRKWLNKNRTYSNGSYVDSLKEALDNDVMSSAGEDLYTNARALWTEKKATLDNPNGIAKVLQEEGINRAVPKEQIAPKIASMPVDQFGHIVDTLKNVPDEIQPAAQASINEIRAHFANQVRSIGTSQQGQWNAKGVLQYLRNNAARMEKVFTPEEMAQFQNLNEAGQIVAKDQSYPGAAVQEHNLARAGVSAAVRYGATATGGAVGSLVGAPGAGAAVGGYFGDKAAGALNDKASLRSAQKRTVKLSDLLTEGK